MKNIKFQLRKPKSDVTPNICDEDTLELYLRISENIGSCGSVVKNAVRKQLES